MTVDQSHISATQAVSVTGHVSCPDEFDGVECEVIKFAEGTPFVTDADSGVTSRSSVRIAIIYKNMIARGAVPLIAAPSANEPIVFCRLQKSGPSKFRVLFLPGFFLEGKLALRAEVLIGSSTVASTQPGVDLPVFAK